MKYLLTTLILALTCATLHAQNVIIQGTGAGAVRGTIGQTPTSVLTNLAVTGTLNPDVTGTNYVQVASNPTYPSYGKWYNSSNGYYIWYWTDNYIIGLAGTGGTLSGPMWYVEMETPIGDYTSNYSSTGTATVAYSYVTNFASTVSVKGIAMP